MMLIVKVATLAFNIVLAANPVVLITLAVIALIAIFVALEKRFGIVSALVEKLGELFESARRIMVGVFEAVSAAVMQFIRFLGRTARQLFEMLTLPHRQALAAVRVIVDGIVGFFRGLPGRIAAFVNSIRDRVAEGFTRGRDFIKARIDAVVGFVRGLPGRVGAFVNSIRDKMTEPFNKARDMIKGAIDAVVGFVRGLGGRIASAASGAFNGLWNAFRGAVNRIVDGWNSLSFTTPSINVLGFKSPSFTFAMPRIPRLADGGIVTGPTLALVGEAGPEAVIPLDGRHSMGTVVVNVSGSVITEGDLIETVRRGLVQSQRSGRRLTI
jgi:phage-related protein